MGAFSLISAIACLGLPTVAGGETFWQEFQRRCLLPMEQRTTLVTDGLEAQPLAIAEGLALLATGERKLQYADADEGVWMEIHSSHAGRRCTMGAAPAPNGLEAEARIWRTQAVDSGRYAVNEIFAISEKGWRVPQMIVSVVVEDIEGSEVAILVAADQAEPLNRP